MKPSLVLIPTTLGDLNTFENVIPDYNIKLTHEIKIFIVEQIRTARRFLRKINHPVDIDDMVFYELNKHTDQNQTFGYLDAIKKGESIGLISEAGTPCVADPGSEIVKLAHEQNINIIPLVGPNSIILSLMASGFNGQNFAFHGYLAVDKNERSKQIQRMETEVYKNNQTQIFIETPYRNMQFFESLLKTCKSNTKLCLASNISLITQFIKTKSIQDWKKEKVDLNKKPTIFLLYK
jgi:16S rRNA (cytidine1402-2'-O)-methyltransferase